MVPEYSDSHGQLPRGVRAKHVTSPVVPEYSDSCGQLPRGVRAKHVPSPLVPESLFKLITDTHFLEILLHIASELTLSSSPFGF